MSTIVKTHWVMDYETLSNCFVAVFEDYKANIRNIFIIHKLANHLPELVKFLERNRDNQEWHISFNGLAFDSQITEYILRDKDILLGSSAEDVAGALYKKAQEIISRQDRGEFSEFSERDLSILQVDLFKLNHWDNAAKRSSLKWIQYSMDWENIQEMPIHHSTEIKSMKEISTVIDYCINDVRSTKGILHKCSDQINLRGTLTGEYNIPLYSASEPRISKELFLLFLSKSIGIRKYDLKQMRTRRDFIRVSDIILPYVKFNKPEFQDLLKAYNNLVINPNNIKGAFKYVLKHKDVKTEYGLGGLHGATNSNIYEAKDGMIIMTSDVTSFYPNLAIRNKWSPAHLPKEKFCELYEWFFEERKKIPKKDPKNYVYKIILNSTYGLSIEPNSFLYDPQFGMQITINGQLLLTMLYEMLSEGIPGSIPLMQNTDGLEMMIPEQYREKYFEICKVWEDMTSLQLEHDQYRKMIIADVNNYIAIPTDEKKEVKCKGRFEFDKLALHKNKSFLIIRKALYNYFVKDMSPEKTLSENKNIYDYCGGVKIKGEWEFKQICVVNGEIQHETLQKTLRYYISESGCKIIKANKNDGREIQLEAGKWMQVVFNKYKKLNWEDYDIDESYYLNYIYKEIANITPPPKIQMQLEFN
jgi:hypothetical protein